MVMSIDNCIMAVCIFTLEIIEFRLYKLKDITNLPYKGLNVNSKYDSNNVMGAMMNPNDDDEDNSMVMLKKTKDN
jgi:hypothetical protein